MTSSTVRYTLRPLRLFPQAEHNTEALSSPRGITAVPCKGRVRCEVSLVLKLNIRLLDACVSTTNQTSSSSASSTVTSPLLEDLAGSSLAAAGDVLVRVDEQMMRVNEAARAGEQIPGRQVADGWGKSEGVGGARIKEVTGRSGAK